MEVMQDVDMMSFTDAKFLIIIVSYVKFNFDRYSVCDWVEKKISESWFGVA